MKRERITLLGATGSIGASTLDVLARHPERFQVHALTGVRRLDVLAEHCRAFAPARVVVGRPQACDQLRDLLLVRGLPIPQIDHGVDALCEVATEADTVMAAIVGAAGLLPTLAAAQAGRRLLLANKEALVMAGPVFMRMVREKKAQLLPIDSEHNAIFQCLPKNYPTSDPAGAPALGVERIVLTASGGPFRTLPIEQLVNVTPDQACAHPNWVMGRKISVDSATMMNKGLEVIEAHWLFGLAPERINVVLHPQSIIHSLVGYRDGSMLAQLGNPDMRTPIAHALAYPERMDAGVAPLDLAALGSLSFEEVDERRFPCLPLAYTALRTGGCAPAVLNAANEVAVEAFLDGRVRYPDIARIVAKTLEISAAGKRLETLDDALVADDMARQEARNEVRKLLVA